MPEDLGQLVGALTRDNPSRTRAAARLMSILENQPHRLPELFKAIADRSMASGSSPDCREFGGPRLVLGLTGAPGSGKSTLTDALVAEFRARHPDRLIGVIAVDPSSPFSGGAVLGDRVRMMRHATDPNVFVRSLATRGHLGGLTLGVKAVTRVMGLLGAEVVILETVGVGQSEVEVARVADHVLVILAPGQGDSIQMLKAGLMEIGDGFVINKADRPDAQSLYAQLLAALRLTGRPIALASDGQPQAACHKAGHDEQDDPPMAAADPAGQPVDVFLVSAVDKTGVQALWSRIEGLIDQRQEAWQARRKQRIADEIRDAILEQARRRVDARLGRNGTFGDKVRRILEGDATVGELADELIRDAARHPSHGDAS